MVRVFAIIGISILVSILYASHDALAENSGRKENLDHAPRLLIRALFAILVGASAHPDFSLEMLYASAISFLSFHIVFDPCKNVFSQKHLWYLSKSSNKSDMIWNRLSPKHPGLTSLIVELVIFSVVLWVYIKAL